MPTAPARLFNRLNTHAPHDEREEEQLSFGSQDRERAIQ